MSASSFSNQQHDRTYLDSLKRATFATVLRDYGIVLPQENGKFNVCCPFHSEQNPSCSINLDTATYRCFACGECGDAISFVSKKKGISFSRAVIKLQAMAGTSEAVPVTSIVAQDGEKTSRQQAQNGFPSKNMRVIRAILRDSEVIFGTHGDSYLRGRGINIANIFQISKKLVPPAGDAPLADLRFHPRLSYYHEGSLLGHYPAIIAVIRDVNRGVVGLHRIYLDEKFPQKAVILNSVGKEVAPKKAIGTTKGAIRLFHPTVTMAVAEGIETALSVTQATGIPCWGAGSIDNLARHFSPDPSCETLYLAADNDSKDLEKNNRLIRQACERLQKKGIKIMVATPPKGTDFNDLLQNESLVNNPTQEEGAFDAHA